MPKSGEHNVNNIDSFFRVRPSRTNLREGETVSFLEDGKLVKQEKRNGVVYEIKLNELGKQETALTKTDESSSSTVFYGGDITNVVAGTGLSGGGSSGSVVLDIDSTVATLTGTQTFTNKTIDLDSNTLTGTLSEFNTALQGDSFVSLTGTETLTNKTLASPSLTGTTTGVNLTLSGNLIVNGTTITIDTDTLAVQDPLIKLAKANSVSDTVDIGFYGLYDTSGSQDLYAGLFRDADDGKFKLFKDLQTEPTSTVNVSGTGYTTGTLVASLEGNASTATALSNSGTLTITGDVTANVTPTYTGGGDLVITLSINDNSIGTDELNVATAGLSGQFLTSNADGSFSWTSNTDIFQIESGTNTNNNVLTATGLDDTIRGESGLTFDSTTNQLTIGTGGSLYLNTTQVINSSGNWVGGGNISQFTNNVGYITGNQTITLSGDVTGSGTTSIATTIAQNVITDYELNVTTGSSGQFLTSNGVGGFTWTDSTSVFSVETGTNTNNYLLTATGLDDTIRGEANLTFDGSTLALTGDLNIGSGDFFVDDSAGQIGIGTTSPNTLLHLYSTSNTQLRLQTTGTNNASNIVYQNGSASYSVGINSAEQFSFYSSQLSGDAGFINTNGWLYWYNPILLTTNNTALKGRDSGGIVRDMLKIDANNDLVIGDSGLNDVYINQNVGIGTSSPQSKLNINVAAESAIPSAGNDTTFLMIGNDGSGTTNYGTMIGTLNTGNGYIQQQRFDGTATTYNLLLQPNGGNVGIGTQSPSAKFEVVGGNLRWKSTDDANTGVQIYSSNGNRQLSFYGYLTSYSALQSDNTSTYKIIQNYSDGDIQFIVKPSSTGVQTEVMRLDGATANVGIGTASPGAKLHVDGSAIFDTDTGNQPFYITRIGTLGQALKIYVDDNDAVFESIQDETVGTVGNFKFVMDSDTAANTRFLHGTAEKFKIESGGNVVMQQGSRLYLDGGGDTYIQSDIADTLRMVAGNINMLEMIEDDTQDQVIIGNGTNDVDFIVEDTSGVAAFTVDAGTGNTTIANDLIVTGSFSLSTLKSEYIRHTNNTLSMTIGSGGDVTFAQGPTITTGGLTIEGGGLSVEAGASSFDANVAIKAASGAQLQLNTSDTIVSNTANIGRINFSAPNEGSGGDALLLAASIQAKASADFTNLSNQTDLLFYTATSETATEKMRITHDGKVGIGQSSPGYKLTVEGDVNINQGSYYRVGGRAALNGDSSYHTFIRPNGVPGIYLGGTDTTNYYDNGAHRFRGAGGSGDLAYLTATGLGIGTTSPAGKLHIDQSSDNVLIVSDNPHSATNATSGISFGGHSNGNVYVDSKTHSGGSILFRCGEGTEYGYARTWLNVDTTNGDVRLANDGQNLYLGAGNDLRLLHSGTESYIYNYSGALYVGAVSTDQDVFIRGNDGGASINALQFDMSDAGTAIFNHDIWVKTDLGELQLGAGKDGRLYSYNDDLYIDNQTLDQDIHLRVNDGGVYTTALFIDGDTSRVGIGTTSPGYKLDISHPGEGLRLNSTGDLQIRFDRSGGNAFSIEHDTSRIYLYNRTTSLLALAVTNANNVGIGTASPSSKLHINGSSNGAGIVTSISNTYYAAASTDEYVQYQGEFYQNDVAALRAGGYIRIGKSGDFSNNANASGHLIFATRNAGTLAEKMRIDSSGNVGIGVTGGTYKLEIPITQKIGYYGDSTHLAYWEPYSGATGHMTLSNYWGGGNAHILLMPDTNVGIGTTSPGDKLHIAGNVRIDGGDVLRWNGQAFIDTIGANDIFIRPNGSTATTITAGGNVLIGGTSASGHGFNLEVLNDHAYVKGPDGWNGTGDKAIVALGSGVSNESFGCGYVYGTGLVLSTYKLSGGGHFGSSTQNSLIIADTTGKASFINDVVAYATSDERLKINVKPLENSIDKINQISGVEFDWIDGKDEYGNSVHGNEGHDIGVIAQEIEKVLPEVVTTRDNGYKAVKYEKIVPLLIEAIKEQQQQINELKEKLNG